MFRVLSLFTLACCLIISTAYSQDYWWDTVITNSVEDLSIVQTVDLDQDGDMDILASAGINEYRVVWWENDGSANFTQHDLYGLEDSLHYVQAVDLDMDNQMDLVAIRSNSSVVWLSNTGGMSFEQLTAISGLVYKPTFVIADYDLDNDPDIIVSDQGGWMPGSNGSITWLELTGNTQFTEHLLLEGEQFHCVGTYDLNDDGHTDLIGGYRQSDEPNYAFDLYENNGDNTFTSYAFLASGLLAPEFAKAADFDQDGDLDILVGYINGFAWFENTGNFTFVEVEDPDFDSVPGQVCIVDIDEDGDPDLLPSGIPALIMANDGSGDFSREIVSVISSAGSVDAADMNGDGSLDIVRLGSSGSSELLWSERSDTEQPQPPGILVNTVTNYGEYSEPNALSPSGEFPAGSQKYYFWGGWFWAGAKVNDEYLVSHANYGHYEFEPSAEGGPRPEREQVVLGDEMYSYSCTYDDLEPADEHTPIGLQIDQTVSAFPAWQGPIGAHLVVQTMTNISGEQLDSVYTAWVFDMDIAGGHGGDPSEPHIDDMCNYQSERQLAYMWDSDYPDSPYDDTGEFGWIPGYSGIKILEAPTETAAFQWWAWSDYPPSDFEKYQYMAGIHPGSGGPYKAEPDTVFDYRVLVSSGPFSLAPDESVDLALTYAIGYGLEGLEDTIDEMTEFWLSAPEDSHGSDQPLQFSLGDPYPNPFNASVMIPFQLKQRGHTEIAVTDILGRRVATLVDGIRNPGLHTVNFAGDDLASGIYFVTLRSANGLQQSRKIVFMK